MKNAECDYDVIRSVYSGLGRAGDERRTAIPGYGCETLRREGGVDLADFLPSLLFPALRDEMIPGLIGVSCSSFSFLLLLVHVLYASTGGS